MYINRESFPISPLIQKGGKQFIPILDDREIKTFFSQPRLNEYLSVANSDPSLAYRLYRWNIQLTESLWMPYHFFEIGLRNLVAKKMSQRFGVSWPISATEQRNWTNNTNPIPALPGTAQGLIVQARNKIRGTTITNDRVISQITFGFWRNMFASHYDRILWTGGIRDVFPAAPNNIDRQAIFARLEPHVAFRNRMAHHEIIFTKQPMTRFQDLMEMCEWMNKDISSLLDHTNDFQSVFGARPT